MLAILQAQGGNASNLTSPRRQCSRILQAHEAMLAILQAQRVECNQC